ncbi:MAG TPA: proprotein convertase P-domain-containing protein, partial [Kofleriaceae bacterium]|nr:proprotein convertase P-domain-containing protein [Kofleriaceae bacterium]
NDSQQTWSRDRMRARMSTLTGTLETVFGHQIVGGGQFAGAEEVQPISSVVSSNLLSTDFTPQPQGAGTDDWSARYAGQLYVAQAGSYTLTIISDNGNLGLLGATRGGDHWARGDATATTTPITANLAAGWNDVSVDYNHVTGTKSLQVQLSGPDFAIRDVPVDQLRPVESHEDRLAFGSEDVSRVIGDNGGPTGAATALLKVDGSPGETVSSIDVTVQLNAKFGPEIKVDLETPAGRRVAIRDNDPGTPDGEQFLQVRVPADAAGQLRMLLDGPVAGTWKLHVYDTSNVGPAGTSTLESARLTLHTTGGPEKIAKSASWISPAIVQATDVFAIDSVTTDERVPGGATLAVFVRTCQQASCSDGTWAGPVAKGTPFAVTPGRYLQLRVDMTSNGVLEPELRSLNVAFRRAP